MPAGGQRIAKLGGARGLAPRAVVFVTALLLAAAGVSALAIMFGAQRESARHQLRVTSELTSNLAIFMRDTIARGHTGELNELVLRSAERPEALGVRVLDGQGIVLAESWKVAASDPLANLGARVLADRRIRYQRLPGGVAIGAPLANQGRQLGALIVVWRPDSYRFEPMAALGPILLVLLLVVLGAAALTARFVRRAVAPLDELARFAGEVAARGETGRAIDIRTGDEIETLAGAFNSMLRRLDRSMRQVQEIAFVDPATQLPNHDRFVREVDFKLMQAKVGASEGGAIAVFELQRLPKLMQTLDPASAREVMRVLAERLTLAVRMVERLLPPSGRERGGALVARLSGHEFGVFAPGANSNESAARFAHHVNAALNQSLEWRGHKMVLASCCGVAIAPRDGADADTAIRRARMALGAAQGAAGGLKVYSPSLDREAIARLTLEREMRAALERNEFRAFFQPKLELSTGRILACEALARWVRPDQTIVSPGRFIPVAEESGLIGALSEAIMREACWKAAAWARAGHPASVAVNVSALQFRSERFADNVLRIVEHAGLAPSMLELEITESVVMEDPDRALRIIRPLREAGLRLAIDDFGCGHSNLAALSRLPFDVIKIDQQFVRAIERDDGQAAAIIEMILALAKTLGMDVVAEGIERAEDAAFMRARGCQWGQGFLYGAAVSAPEFAEMLRGQIESGTRAVSAA